MFKLFANSMMNGRAFAPMMDADTGTDIGSGGAGEADDKGQEAGQGESGAGEGEEDQKEGKDQEKVTFSPEQQEAINKLIGRKVAEERSKAEAERQKAEERARMTAEEKAEADRKEREQKAEQREKAANDKIITLEIKDAARAADVPAKKVERFLKLVDKESISLDDNGDVSRSDVEAAVQAVLADMPEFKAPESQKGPGGDYNGNNHGPKYSKAQIEGMTPEEISKNWTDVQKSMALHNKK